MTKQSFSKLNSIQSVLIFYGLLVIIISIIGGALGYRTNQRINARNSTHRDETLVSETPETSITQIFLGALFYSGVITGLCSGIIHDVEVLAEKEISDQVKEKATNQVRAEINSFYQKNIEELDTISELIQESDISKNHKKTYISRLDRVRFLFERYQYRRESYNNILSWLENKNNRVLILEEIQNKLRSSSIYKSTHQKYKASLTNDIRTFVVWIKESCREKGAYGVSEDMIQASKTGMPDSAEIYTEVIKAIRNDQNLNELSINSDALQYLSSILSERIQGLLDIKN